MKYVKCYIQQWFRQLYFNVGGSVCKESEDRLPYFHSGLFWNVIWITKEQIDTEIIVVEAILKSHLGDSLCEAGSFHIEQSTFK